jgi:hypothetical protein
VARDCDTDAVKQTIRRGCQVACVSNSLGGVNA